MDPNNNNNQNNPNPNQWNQWLNPNNQYQHPNQYLNLNQFQQFPNPNNQYQHPNQFQNYTQLPNPNQFPHYYQQTPSPQRPSVDPIYQGSFTQMLNEDHLTNFPRVPPYDINDSEDDEVVPETQAQEMPARGKGKRKQKKKETESLRGKTDRQKWTEEEEMALSSAWSSTSEDPVLGNAQNTPLYWDSVRAKFFAKMLKDNPSYYRTEDSLSSKWRDLRRKVKKFNGFFRQAQQSRPSGHNDQQVLETAMASYRNIMQGGFLHLSSWKILKNSPICQNVPTSGGSRKARRTSESSNPSTPATPATPVSPFASFDLNDDDDDLEEDLPRPTGRDQARAKARKGKGKAVASSSGNEDSLKYIGEKFGKFADTEEEKMRQKALKVIMKDTDNLREPAKSIAEHEKRRLIEKFYPEFL